MTTQEQRLRQLLQSVASGNTSVDEALEGAVLLPYEDLGFAKVDHHRSIRRGMPEVIFGEGKEPQHVAKIAQAIAERGERVFVTRASPEQAEAVLEVLPDGTYDARARCIWHPAALPEPSSRDEVMVVCAGTSDLPVAQEALVTLQQLGQRCQLISDIGVSGLHRLLSHMPALRKARVLIVVAGMEGALPSVVAGLVECPVIAVPTTIGYGASFGGLAALLGMLNSCASGVVVVNIGNGFGAARAAALMNKD